MTDYHVLEQPRLPRAAPPKPSYFSADGNPIIPQYERGDIGGEFIRRKR